MNPFMVVVVIAFIVGVAAPWALWAMWIGPKKGSRKELQAAERALESARQQSAHLLLDLQTRQADADHLRQQQGDLLKELDESRAQADHNAERVRRVLDSEGRIWERPVDGPLPRFRQLGPRKAPIISLMNLKGGVGKTTIAANIGATMANANTLARHVLLVDLDYQGSLTSLCLNGRTIQGLRQSRRLVDVVFADQAITPAVLNRTLEPIAQTTAMLLAADEDLTNCEQRQMTRWLIGESRDDVRFRLRSLLHSDEIQGQFEAILLDCPPRLTTASINALAASDFVLIPTLLDSPSWERVPALLRWLRRLKDHTPLCSNLAVLGIVANQVQEKNRLTPREQEAWDRLQQSCRDTWGDRVNHFATAIPRREAFPQAAERNQFAAFDRDLVDIFQDLVREIDQGMPALAGVSSARG
jgi:cellulose biosynthesis protein BcsQ